MNEGKLMPAEQFLSADLWRFIVAAGLLVLWHMKVILHVPTFMNAIKFIAIMLGPGIVVGWLGLLALPLFSSYVDPTNDDLRSFVVAGGMIMGEKGIKSLLRWFKDRADLFISPR